MAHGVPGNGLESARETYEREQQLHATNRELRQMNARKSSTGLKIAAEKSLNKPARNPRMPHGLAPQSKRGRSLVEQATRTMSLMPTPWKVLGHDAQIAPRHRVEEKMPSVADLLKQSAGQSGAKVSPVNPVNKVKNLAQQPGGEQSKSGSFRKPNTEEQKKAKCRASAIARLDSKPVKAKTILNTNQCWLR